MAVIATNADLYFAISQLIAQYEKDPRPLEEYLRALWIVSLRHRGRASLAPNEFFDLLAEAFVAEAMPYDPNLAAWHGPDFEPGTNDLFDVEIVLVRQIVDLREMATNGQLADPHRYLGIDAPPGSRWYNFDPCTFLECGVAGAFGGRNWEDEPDREAEPLTAISWEDFRDFLQAGQGYE